MSVNNSLLRNGRCAARVRRIGLGLSLMGLMLAVGVGPARPSMAQDAATNEIDTDSLRERISLQLRRELGFWYPAAIDEENGGFRLLRVDSDPHASVSCPLVYQSRLTWVAAEAIARGHADHQAYAPIVRHGVAFLRDVMWDRQRGGFFWEVHQSHGFGWQGDRFKHVYGIGFTIYALATAGQTLGDEQVLDLAEQAFVWLDDHAHDDRNGGYFEFLNLDGSLILEPLPNRPRDLIGTPIGYKSMNAHLHLLEAFTALYQARPSERLRSRLGEVFFIMRDRVAMPAGAMHQIMQADWQPVPGSTSWGHNVEAAYLLLEADHVLKNSEKQAAQTMERARQLVDQSLAFGWDEQNGGFFEEGGTFGPVHNRCKTWWAQAEGLHSLLLMYELSGKPTYLQHASRQWDLIEEVFLVDDIGAWWRSWHPGQEPRVASEWIGGPWQGPYHTTRALMNALDSLDAAAATSDTGHTSQ